MANVSKSLAIRSLVLIFSWAVLRFYAMTELRHWVFRSIEFERDFQIVVGHALIVFEGLLLLLLAYLLMRRTLSDAIAFTENSKRALKIGVLFGLLSFVTTIPVALMFGMSIQPRFDWVGFVANLFSNAAEEVIYRGLLLFAFTRLFGSQPLAVVLSGLAFGLGHWDVPYAFQAYIAGVGVLWAIAYLKTRNLIAPYLAHMIADTLADSLFR